MAVTVTPFNVFPTDLANGNHDLDSDTIRAVLCNAANAPVATNTQLSNLTQISNGGGYLQGGYTLQSVSGTTTGTQFKMDADDLPINATGGSIATFRYIALYNDTVTGDPLILFYDLGSDISLSNGSSYTLEFDASNGILTIDVV